MSIGNRIKKARKRAGITQPELAKKCGWESQSRISMYERGVREPSYSDLRSLSRALGASIHWLLDGQAEISVKPNDKAPTQMVPLINWVQAGSWQEVSLQCLNESEWEYVSTGLNAGPRSFALVVRGDSMEPEFIEGTQIIVDPDYEANNGSFIVALLDNDQSATFKQLIMDAGRSYLKPLNPRYPIIEINAPITICGVVREQSKRYE